MMKKTFKRYWIGVLLAILCACDKQTGEANGGPLTLRFSVQFPEAASVRTRSWADVPDYAKLDLWCVVFQENGNSAENFLLQVKKARHTPGNASANAVMIPFEVELAPSDENAIIHFIAIDNTLSDAENPMLHLDYGPENVLIPRLSTAGGHDAYWQRIDFGMPLNESNATAIQARLNPVPLVRNFAKISVRLSDELAQRTNSAGKPVFELEGFWVVNTPDRGSIAPFNGINGFFPDFVSGTSALDYESITRQPYTGTLPTGTRLINTPDSFADQALNKDPKYVYERPYNPNDRSYLVVAGKYSGDALQGSAVAGSGKTTYYKVDLGKYSQIYTASEGYVLGGYFVFYHLLRNFDYQVVITGVESDGVATPAEAVSAVPSNNLSSSVETQHLLSITDGNDMIYVNATSFVFAKKSTAFDLLYRYFEISGGADAGADIPRNEWVVWNDPEVGCRPGDVIEEAVKQADYVDEAGRRWGHIRITPHSPEAEMKTQSVTLYRPNGLSRTIVFYLRRPWPLERGVVWGGGAYDRRPDEVPSDDPEYENKYRGATEGRVAKSDGAELTLFFNLPLNLPKAIFPLSFVIESDRQDIENNKIAEQAPVQSGTSLFEGVLNSRIQYVKTVRWEDYDPAFREGNPTWMGNLVNCSFTTIATAEAGTATTTLRIDNEYFDMLDVSFTR